MRPARLVAVVAALCVALAAPALADTDDDVAEKEAQLEQAQQRREALEARLATAAGDLEGLEEQVHEAEEVVASLDAEERAIVDQLAELEDRIAGRARLAYMRADLGPVRMVLAGQDATAVAEGTALLSALTLGDRAEAEDAAVLRTRLDATRERRVEELTALDELRATAEEAAQQIAADLEQIAADEERFAEELEEAREEARRRREEELRRQREEEEQRRTAGGGDGGSGGGGGDGGGGGPAPSTGGYACPVGNPVAFTDTWGAPRSGGRSHQGVDMMAPHGTPVYAITGGTITRMNGNSLGGISLYMFGADGNEYYYTHLQGYAAESFVGRQVAAGTLIAYVGSTGNASASAPHLHFEVHPGGGSPVNPYPWAAMACGR